MIYFSSDFHFGHSKIIELCNRPFQSTHEMNSTIVDNINAKVKTNDIFYVLGDFCFNNPSRYLDYINCKNIILIIGNHDFRNRSGYPKKILYSLYKEVHQFLIINVNGVRFSLFHYPLSSWPTGTIHLHGHTHCLCKLKKNRIDVGVDNWNFQPLSVEEILKINEKL